MEVVALLALKSSTPNCNQLFKPIITPNKPADLVWCVEKEKKSEKQNQHLQNLKILSQDFSINVSIIMSSKYVMYYNLKWLHFFQKPIIFTFFINIYILTYYNKMLLK